MPLRAAIADNPSSRSGWPTSALFAWAAIAVSLIIAAWITGSNLPSLASAALPPNADRTTFEDRFLPAPTLAKSDPLRPLKHSVLASLQPQGALAMRSMSQDLGSTDVRSTDLRASIADEEPQASEAKPTAQSGIPLPRSRPPAADLATQPSQALALATTTPTTAALIAPTTDIASRPAERSVLQKFSDMMKARMTIASLGLGRAPDLVALGYDNETAVYDITAHAIYLPNGTVMEAHSGMGGLRDDPDHVSVPNTGATPPAVYSLKPRETNFHGVAALRMTPAEGSDIGGRSGLLVHSYMLGPNGDSNGCISVRDFDRFRKAYDDGQFTHIAVVPSVKAIILAQQNAD